MKNNTKKALVFGVTGQDGSYLSELLLSKDYVVYGVVRRSSTDTRGRIEHLLTNPDFHCIEGDIVDPSSVNQIFRDHMPDECYNLAAQSHVAVSFSQPALTFQINTIGVLNILEAIRHISPKTRVYQASTSEMFGSNYNTDPITKVIYQDEMTALYPNSPYAVAKLASHHMIRMYRDAYNIFAASGILFNHESKRRGENFVTRKITKYVAEHQNAFGRWDVEPLKLGNLDAGRDWGHAKDYVEAMWLMLQQETPADFVIGTGRVHTVKDFLTAAFACVGVEDWTPYVVVDPKFYRPLEVPHLASRPERAKKWLSWEATTTFEELVEDMVLGDIEALDKYAKL